MWLKVPPKCHAAEVEQFPDTDTAAGWGIFVGSLEDPLSLNAPSTPQVTSQLVGAAGTYFSRTTWRIYTFALPDVSWQAGPGWTKMMGMALVNFSPQDSI